MKSKIIDEAFDYWSSKKPLESGRIIYNQIPNDQRPIWAAEILNLCRRLTSSVPEIDAVYEIALNQQRWKEAHDAFSRVRNLTLAFEKSKSKNSVYGGLLYLAENTAKVIYNASGEPAPFDYDSGWWLVSNLRYIVDEIKSSEFEAKAWSKVCSFNQTVA